MGTVWRIAYEIVGDGIEVAKAHEATIKAARDKCWAITKELRATGYRPHGDGGIRTLLFEGGEPPEGFKSVGRHGKSVEVTPRKNTKIGKDAATKLAAAPRWPNGEDLARDLGWRPAQMPMDGYKIYWPTYYGFKLPSESYWLHIPRMADDGFEPGDFLVERPESALMLAMEAHNAAVAALPERAAA